MDLPAAAGRREEGGGGGGSEGLRHGLGGGATGAIKVMYLNGAGVSVQPAAGDHEQTPLGGDDRVSSPGQRRADPAPPQVARSTADGQRRRREVEEEVGAGDGSYGGGRQLQRWEFEPGGRVGVVGMGGEVAGDAAALGVDEEPWPPAGGGG